MACRPGAHDGDRSPFASFLASPVDPMAIHIALALSLGGSLALAALLLAWADAVTGARLLVAFLCGVAVWIVGNELPTWLGPEFERPALMLLATAALTSAVFFHFALVFTGAPASRPLLGVIYGTGLAAMLLSVAIPSGSFRPFADVARMAVPNTRRLDHQRGLGAAGRCRAGRAATRVLPPARAGAAADRRGSRFQRLGPALHVRLRLRGAGAAVLSLAASAAAGLSRDPGLRHPALPRVRGECLGAPRGGAGRC